MANRKKNGFKQPEELVSQRARLAASGAAGVHDDQNARRRGAHRTNRVGSRSAALRSSLRDGGW